MLFWFHELGSYLMLQGQKENIALHAATALLQAEQGDYQGLIAR